MMFIYLHVGGNAPYWGRGQSLDKKSEKVKSEVVRGILCFSKYASNKLISVLNNV